jgi:RNA polymerase sigma-70 factor (sigma-E family)
VQSDFGGLAVPAGIVAGGPGLSHAATADEAVTSLYQVHAGGLIRLAVVMVGDRATAEDAVQDAFFGLYQRWTHLNEPAKALSYVRSAVLNRCRSVQRHRARRTGIRLPEPAAASAEMTALVGEERRALLAALMQLPPRQREALGLRFFADLDEAEIAQTMGISRGTVKSTISRGIAALARRLGDSSEVHR